jgi:hypothetical protein
MKMAKASQEFFDGLENATQRLGVLVDDYFQHAQGTFQGWRGGSMPHSPWGAHALYRGVEAAAQTVRMHLWKATGKVPDSQPPLPSKGWWFPEEGNVIYEIGSSEPMSVDVSSKDKLDPSKFSLDPASNYLDPFGLTREERLGELMAPWMMQISLMAGLTSALESVLFHNGRDVELGTVADYVQAAILESTRHAMGFFVIPENIGPHRTNEAEIRAPSSSFARVAYAAAFVSDLMEVMKAYNSFKQRSKLFVGAYSLQELPK